MPSDPQLCLQSVIQPLGLDRAQRHLLLCATPTKPKCCDLATGQSSWDYLKRRLQELQLDAASATLRDRPTADRPSCILRTKADCLRVCQQGPILVIHPDGVWYHSVTPEVLEHIIQRHLLNNEIVTEYAFLQSPLMGAEPEATQPKSSD
jgi:(2Fe-2S) ferredoxin